MIVKQGKSSYNLSNIQISKIECNKDTCKHFSDDICFQIHNQYPVYTMIRKYQLVMTLIITWSRNFFVNLLQDAWVAMLKIFGVIHIPSLC